MLHIQELSLCKRTLGFVAFLFTPKTLMSAEVIRRMNDETQQVHLELAVQQPGTDAVPLTQIALLIHSQINRFHTVMH